MSNIKSFLIASGRAVEFADLEPWLRLFLAWSCTPHRGVARAREGFRVTTCDASATKGCELDWAARCIGVAREAQKIFSASPGTGRSSLIWLS